MSKHRIVFDARMSARQGLGRYIDELISRIEPMARAEGYSLRLLTRQERRADLLERYPAAEVINCHSEIYTPHEQLELPFKAGTCSLFHAPHFNLPAFSPAPLIVTVHDLTHLREPRLKMRPFGKTYVRCMLGLTALKASEVLTVSEFSKRELLEFLPWLSPDKVTVTHEAAAPHFKPEPDEARKRDFRSRHGLHKPFVLYVGLLSVHKNLLSLAEAVERVRARGSDIELVLIGTVFARFRSSLPQLRKYDFVRMLGPLPDHETVLAYNCAEMFTLVSFREGFGITALEAMQCGSPAVLSGVCSLPEVGGDAAVYCDPADAGSIADRIRSVLTDSGLRRSMVEKGFKQAARFSWDACASRTFEAYLRTLRA